MKRNASTFVKSSKDGSTDALKVMAPSVAWITVVSHLASRLEQVPMFNGCSNKVALRNLFFIGGNVYSYLVILWKNIFYVLLLRFIYSSTPIQSDGAAMNALLFIQPT